MPQTLAVAVLALFCITASAANYYVDYSGGNDSAAGTNTATAWQHCPGDPNATGTAASTTLSPGDVVYFKGGVPYVLVGQGINVVAGSAGNPVTYDGNSTGAWGTGKAIVTDNNSANGIRAFQSASGNMANVSFKGFKFTNIGGGTLPAATGSAIPAKPGYGIVAQTMTNVLISGCYFGQLGYYQNVAPIGNSSLAGDGIECYAGCNGLVITNCEFTQMRDPVQLLPGGNIFNATIADCFFHDQMEWAITILHNTDTYLSNLFIVGCTFSNTDQYYVGTNSGGLWTGYGGGPHQNAIMMFGAEGCSGNCALDRPVGDTNVFIHNNYFVDTMGHPGGSTCFWLQDGTSADIYNNIFNCAKANNEISVSEPPTNTVFHVGIYNNTIYGGAPHINVSGIVAYANGWITDVSGRNVIVENNVLSTLNIGNNNAFDYQAQCSASTFSQFTKNVFFNYNFYFCDQTLSGHGMVFGQLLDPTQSYITSNNCVSLLGWDANSRQGTPMFVSASPTNPANNNFHLQTNSAAIGNGVNLSALNLPGLNADYYGNPRPATGNWTIGAVGGGTTRTGGTAMISVAPSSLNFSTIVAGTTTNQAFTVQNTGTTSVSGSASVAAPFSVVSGGSYTLAPGQSQTVTVSYHPTSAGTNSQTVSFSNSGGSGASATVTGIAEATIAPPTSDLSFQAAAAVITAPFVLTNGYFSQSLLTTNPSVGGQAVFTFTITNAGAYVVQALVNAPNDANNSFFVNMDAQPVDPTMIWDIPVTAGFAERVVSWRGDGTDVSNQYVPEVFNLTAGVHQLIIRGREANVQLESLALLPSVSPPEGLHVVGLSP